MINKIPLENKIPLDKQSELQNKLSEDVYLLIDESKRPPKLILCGFIRYGIPGLKLSEAIAREHENARPRVYGSVLNVNLELKIESI